MAAPPSVNAKALSGKFLLNKSLSDSPDEFLRLQGVAWWKRRAVSMFPLTIRVKHATDEAGIEHFDMDQIIYSIPAMREEATLDARERDREHFIFGCQTTKSRRIAVDEIADAYLKDGWTEDCLEAGVVENDTWSTPGKNNLTWRNVQMWGFSMLDGERRFVTLITFTSSLKQDGPVRARFVYDYASAE